MVAQVKKSKLYQRPKEPFHNSPLGGGYGSDIVYTISYKKVKYFCRCTLTPYNKAMDNKFILFIGAFLLLFVIGLSSYFSLFSLPKLTLPEGRDFSLEEILINNETVATTTVGQKEETVLITVASTTFTVRVADTVALRARGLSGSLPLGLSEGMFFIFPEPAYHSFWMSDLTFPIDIIWIADDGKIAGVAENAMPILSDQEPTYYVPPVPVRYVLEVAAGTYARFRFATGTPVTLDDI